MAENGNVRPPLLEVRGVEVRFGGRPSLLARHATVARAVDGVDLTVHEGEVLALVGESGCGKTTLARTIVGLQKPATGEILFRGKPISDDLRRYRRHVQLVFQDPTGALNPRQTVYEAVAEGPRIHRLPGDERARVITALTHAGLRPAERFFLSYPHELSGGQRQRVVIAGALALEPTLIVADEPVSSLDASVKGEILRLILDLIRELGLAVLLVTHDLGTAWQVADRVAVMYLGRIVEIGPAENVLNDPRHPYTQALLSVVPEIEQVTPIVLSGETPDPTRIPAGCRFHPRCPLYAETNDPRCVGDDPALLPPASPHAVACHLATVPERV